MSRRDDEIAGSTPPQQPLPRRGSIVRTIGQAQERNHALPITAVGGGVIGEMTASASISISALASITTSTVIFEPAEAQADPITAFCDRWLKFALPRHFYRKQVAQVLADWDHELEEAEAPRLWITMKNGGYLLWAIAKWPFVVWLVLPLIAWYQGKLW